MEELKMPMREIQKRYTKSEMTIMAWRSQEMSTNMNSQRQPVSAPQPKADNAERTVQSSYQPPETDKTILDLEDRMGPGLTNKLDEGLDLRKLTGAEAARFMAAQGMNVPMMPRPRRT